MENTANSSVPDFKELNYTRPDLDKFTETVRNVRLRLMTAKTIEAADEALGEYEIAISSFDTQYALCQILHDLDTAAGYPVLRPILYQTDGSLFLRGKKKIFVQVVLTQRYLMKRTRCRRGGRLGCRRG